MEFLLEGEKNVDWFDQIEKELYENRIINLTDNVSNMMVDPIVNMIQHINLQDDKDNISIKERKPIEIHLDSYGGSVYDGFSIVSAMLNSKTPIHTYVPGYAMSMGLALFMAGSKRYVSRFSTLMYHELSSSLNGSREEIRRASEEYDRLQGMYDDFIVERSKLTKEELKEHQEKVFDWYISANVAIEKGIATDMV